MLNLSQKSNLVYGFSLTAIVMLLLAFLLGYFLYYNLKKAESVPAKPVKSTVMDIAPELLQKTQPNTTKGGEEK